MVDLALSDDLAGLLSASVIKRCHHQFGRVLGVINHVQRSPCAPILKRWPAPDALAYVRTYVSTFVKDNRSRGFLWPNLRRTSVLLICSGTEARITAVLHNGGGGGAFHLINRDGKCPGAFPCSFFGLMGFLDDIGICVQLQQALD